MDAVKVEQEKRKRGISVMVRPITVSELADMAGVKSQAICAARKIGGALYNAVLPSGRLNAAHPDVINYIERNKTRLYYENKVLGGEEATEEEKENLTDQALSWLDHLDRRNASEYLNMPLTEIINKFGSNTAFCDWLKSVKLIEEVREKQIKNEETLGTLIQRDFVKQHVIAIIEALHVRILNDAPRTLAAIVVEAQSQNLAREELEKKFLDSLSSFLRSVKARVLRGLSNA